MKNKLNKNIYFLLIGLCVGVIVSMLIGYFSGSLLFSRDNNFMTETRLNDKKYKFTKPLLTSLSSNENETLKWFPEERKLKSLVEDTVNENDKVVTSVFFLNLENSGWFGVNASDTFIPASLLKLPMLISYYKLSEEEKDLFDKSIFYEGGVNFNTYKNIGTGTIVPGQTYTVRELTREMIVNSDNNALQLLYKYRENSLKKIFLDMNIHLPGTDEDIASKDFLTTRDIARFLLVLYNSSYLNIENSEEALKVLSEASFKDGLVAGVPSTIVVSHKFGERTLKENNGTVVNELHDCGIVYHPRVPYIVCVMTKGSDFESEKLQIQKISKIIYNKIDDFSRVK